MATGRYGFCHGEMLILYSRASRQTPIVAGCRVPINRQGSRLREPNSPDRLPFGLLGAGWPQNSIRKEKPPKLGNLPDSLRNIMVTSTRRPMRRSTLGIARLLILGSIAVSWLCAAETANADLERRFAQTVRPFLAAYCIACHGGATPAAQLDLRPYSTLAAVTRDYPRWNLVLE